MAEKKEPKVGQSPVLPVQKNAKGSATEQKQGKFGFLNGKNKKFFFIALGTFGVLALVGAGYSVLTGGGEDSETPVMPPPNLPAKVSHTAVPVRPAQPVLSKRNVAVRSPVQTPPVQTPQTGIRTETVKTSVSHSSQGRPAVMPTVPVQNTAPRLAGASSPQLPKRVPNVIPNAQVQAQVQRNNAEKQDNNLVPPQLVGSMVQQAIQEAVNKIVADYKEKLDKEFKEKYAKFLEQQNTLGAPKVINGGDEGESEKERTGSVPMGEENLPALIIVRAKVITPDGRIMLKTDYGEIVQGAVIMGWKVDKIDDKYVYLSRKVEKKIPVRKLVTDPNTGVKYHKTVYKKITEVQRKKIPYTVAF